MNRKFRKRGGRFSLAAALLLLTISLHAQQPAGARPAGTAPAAMSSAAPLQPSVHEFSVAQAVEYAGKNSVFVKNALLDYEIQEQSNRAITSQALPQVTGGAGFTQYLQVPVTPVPGGLFPGTVPGKVYPFPFGVTYNSNANVTLKQVIFDGQVFVGLQARQASLDFYRKKQEVTEQAIRVNIYKVYYQLLIARAEMSQVDADIDNQQALLHSATEMFRNGFAEQLDVDKSTVQLANMQTTKIQLELNIENGYLGLKVLMGMPVRDSLRLTDSLTYDMIRDAALTDEYKYADRRDFQLMMISRTLGEFNVKRYKREYIPTLNFSATYQQSQYSEKLDLTARNSWYPASFYSLNLSIPIFDGFYKDANIRQARLQLRQTENNIDSLKNRIDNDVRQSQLQFSAALATLDFQKKNVDLAEKVYQQTRKKFEQGLGSNTEITTAFSDERTAQYNFFNALYSAVVARVDYLNAIGKL